MLNRAGRPEWVPGSLRVSRKLHQVTIDDLAQLNCCAVTRLMQAGINTVDIPDRFT
jgi:hypothetical protein